MAHKVVYGSDLTVKINGKVISAVDHIPISINISATPPFEPGLCLWNPLWGNCMIMKRSPDDRYLIKADCQPQAFMITGQDLRKGADWPRPTCVPAVQLSDLDLVARIPAAWLEHVKK